MVVFYCVTIIIFTVYCFTMALLIILRFYHLTAFIFLRFYLFTGSLFYGSKTLWLYKFAVVFGCCTALQFSYFTVLIYRVGMYANGVTVECLSVDLAFACDEGDFSLSVHMS